MHDNKKDENNCIERAFCNTAPPGGAGEKEATRVLANADSDGGLNLIDKLCDVDQTRIEDMERAGVEMQVLSLFSPEIEQLGPQEAIKLAKETNDYLAPALKK